MRLTKILALILCCFFLTQTTFCQFDLATYITLSNGEDDIVHPGETVSFTLVLINQGVTIAENVDITLMIPDGLTSTSGLTNMGTITFDGPLDPGVTIWEFLEFEVDNNISSAVELIVKAEITAAEDQNGTNPMDIDSTPDADFTNDPGGVVDSNTDNTINNENGDEDDSDPENVFVEIVGPNVNFTSIDYPVLENISQTDICLQLSEESTSTVNAEISYTGGTAVTGNDFIAFPLVQQITFPANSTIEQCFTINLLDDNLIESNETIEFEISNITSSQPANIGSDNISSVTILDNDDSDNDNVENTVDNCPNNFNPLQEDVDNDLIGDACDDENIISILSEFQDHIYINNPLSSVIIKSIDEKCWVLVVSIDGSLSTVSVECPN